MPRDLPLGNGSLLVNFDASYQLRDLYWPHVGLENHSNGHVFRFGVWVDGRFRWLDDPGWSRRLRYADETLVTEVELSHPDLDLELRCRDAVDFHQNLYLRQIDVRNPTDRHREVRFFFHHDLYISSHEVGDTAYYEPERRAVYHYKGPRWFLINTATPGKQPEDATDTVEGWHIGVHQWACGHKGVNSLQGTWKDAEDGLLSGNPIAQGSVDSTVAAHLTVPPQTARRGRRAGRPTPWPPPGTWPSPAPSTGSAARSSATRASCCTSTTRPRRWPRAGIRGSATAAKSYRSRRTKPRWSSGPCGCIFRSGRISNTSSRSTARSSFAPPISWRPIAIRRPGCRSHPTTSGKSAGGCWPSPPPRSGRH